MKPHSPGHSSVDDGAAEAPDVETSSDAYARRFAGPVGEWFLEVQGSTALDLLASLPKGARVLDVGGGHAQLTPYLVGAGFETVVVGSSRVCSRRVRHWLDQGQVVFEHAELDNLPFSGRSFDAVLAFRLLAHVGSPENLIRELCRVADRIVVVDYASTRSLNLVSRAAFMAKRQLEGDTRPYRTCSPGAIRGMFADVEFRVTAARPQFLIPMAAHRMASSVATSRFCEATALRLGLTRVFGSPVILRADRTLNAGLAETERGSPNRAAGSPSPGAGVERSEVGADSS